ncbi:hypothetical protein JXA56_02375 [Candidatus Micrarchaeota archaeon]|nr:hypothetical protein [Candidatus Micrarchaeota archaeon]
MRGQAAVEYLMTYGWAILALVIVVGILLFSGLLSPTHLVSDECNFGNNLPCISALFNEGSNTRLAVNMFNGFAYPIRIVRISIVTTDGAGLSGIPTNIDIESGGNSSFIATLNSEQLGANDLKRFIGNITYVSCAPEIGDSCGTKEHVVTGRIVGKVIPQ